METTNPYTAAAEAARMQHLGIALGAILLLCLLLGYRPTPAPVAAVVAPETI